MQENLERAQRIAEESFSRYQTGTIGILDLLQALRREVDTVNTFLDAFLGWRQSLQRLQDLTYYDFEADLPVLDRFDIDVEAAMENGGTTGIR